MEEKKQTVYDVVKGTIELLSNISVPAYLTDQVSAPICQAINNLNVCLKAWELEAQQETNQEVQETPDDLSPTPEPDEEPTEE